MADDSRVLWTAAGSDARIVIKTLRWHAAPSRRISDRSGSESSSGSMASQPSTKIAFAFIASWMNSSEDGPAPADWPLRVKMRKAHGEHFGTAAPLKADPSPRSSERTIRARSGREQSQQNRSIFDHLVTRSDWGPLKQLHFGSRRVVRHLLREPSKLMLADGRSLSLTDQRDGEIPHCRRPGHHRVLEAAGQLLHPAYHERIELG